MKNIASIAILVAAISLTIGLISRLFVLPMPITPGKGVEAHAFLEFANTCLLISIALTLLQIAKTKQ